MSQWDEILPVPRAPFIPSVVWVDNDPPSEGFVAVTREHDPDRWNALVAADEPIVTQVDDGLTHPHDVGLYPTSSSSKPSVMVAMLSALGAEPGDRVLEIGTGTGWNAALLCARVGGSGRVVTVEFDTRVARDAERALHGLGYEPVVVAGDGLFGHAAEAPYDRVICTASVRRIPGAWIEQARPGGVIVAPWGTDYSYDALTRLQVRDDGTAVGRLGEALAFMRVRSQRRDYLEPTPVELESATVGHTTRGAQEMYEVTAFEHAAFTIGLRVPCCYLTVEDPTPGRREVEFHDAVTRSWAQVTMTRDGKPWTVRQIGSRHLWDEVEQAYTWWQDRGRPSPDAYTLTVSGDGDHTVTLDGPAPVGWPIRV